MDIFAIRRTRLKMMVDTVSQGNISAFAGKFGYSRAQISQYLSESYNGGRSIGERAARTLEEKFHAPTGWLDQPLNSLESLTIADPTGHPSRVLSAASDLTEKGIVEKNVLVAGMLVPASDGLVEIKGFPTGTDRKFLEFYSTTDDAYAFQVKGAGLRPRVKSGEYLIIEPSTKPMPGDDVFVKLASGELMVLQLLYTRDDEYTFGDLNENGPTAVVPEYDVVVIATISAIVAVRHTVDFL